MQAIIQSMSQSPLGFWGCVFAILSVFLLVLLWISLSGKKQDKEILEVIAKRLEENSEEDQLRILQSVNDSIQKSNAQLRMEVNDSLSRLTQTQNQNMVGFTDLIQKMNQGNASVQLQAREALKTQVSQLSSGINQELQCRAVCKG